MFDLQRVEERFGLAVCATGKEMVEDQTTGDGSMENGGFT
jgi:hypothetical protein